MLEQDVAATVQRYLRAVQDSGIPVRFGVVFGSQVSGRRDEWSDIDVLVVSPAFDETRDRRQIALLWRLTAQVDSRIEPVPCGERQWESDDSSALIEIARRQGERVPLAA
jgi:predicted nucleotidyltransferase